MKLIYKYTYIKYITVFQICNYVVQKPIIRSNLNYKSIDYLDKLIKNHKLLGGFRYGVFIIKHTHHRAEFVRPSI